MPIKKRETLLTMFASFWIKFTHLVYGKFTASFPSFIPGTTALGSIVTLKMLWHIYHQWGEGRIKNWRQFVNFLFYKNIFYENIDAEICKILRNLIASILVFACCGLSSQWVINYLYYMATIVRALWLAAERALFSCNDRALWNFSRLDGSFELWVKLHARGRKQQKRWTKYNYIFNNWKKN